MSPIGFKNSSRSISPGDVGATRLPPATVTDRKSVFAIFSIRMLIRDPQPAVR
jgi:hypothetical protein